jgi:hypothetical protein
VDLAVAVSVHQRQRLHLDHVVGREPFQRIQSSSAVLGSPYAATYRSCVAPSWSLSLIRFAFRRRVAADRRQRECVTRSEPQSSAPCCRKRPEMRRATPNGSRRLNSRTPEGVSRITGPLGPRGAVTIQNQPGQAQT